MGKRLRKRRGIGALAVMDEAQPAAARTSRGRRISKRRKVAVATGEYQISHLELRSRSVVLKPRIARSAANSGGRRKSTAGLARISRCSSNDSCEATPELDTETFFRCNEERKETAASSNHGDDASDLESTVEMESRSRSTLVAMPSESELEEFFAAAERDLRRQFAERYNFDVVKDAPLAGRYEWIPLAP